MLKKKSNIYKWLSGMIVSLSILCAFLLFGIRLFGLTPYTILSSSMEPNYPTGAIIYVKKVDVNTLQVGDVITFHLSSGMTATHRVVDIIQDEVHQDIKRYQTKGDNNNIIDGKLVEMEQIIGKPVFTLPYLGYFANYIGTPTGSVVVCMIAVILIGLVFCLETLSEEKKG